jgi:hypothetical protein
VAGRVLSSTLSSGTRTKPVVISNDWSFCEVTDDVVATSNCLCATAVSSASTMIANIAAA